jgi:hypothetical protein
VSVWAICISAADRLAGICPELCVDPHRDSHAVAVAVTGTSLMARGKARFARLQDMQLVFDARTSALVPKN